MGKRDVCGREVGEGMNLGLSVDTNDGNRSSFMESEPVFIVLGDFAVHQSKQKMLIDMPQIPKGVLFQQSLNVDVTNTRVIKFVLFIFCLFVVVTTNNTLFTCQTRDEILIKFPKEVFLN